MTPRGNVHINFETEKGPRTIVLSNVSKDDALALQSLLIDNPRVVAIRGSESRLGSNISLLAHASNVAKVANTLDGDKASDDQQVAA